MNIRIGIIMCCLLAFATCSVQAASQTPDDGQLFDQAARDFLAKIPADLLDTQVVQHAGRFAPLGIVARGQIGRLCGIASPDGVSPAAACLELYFNAGKYADRPVIYVRSKAMRAAIAKVEPVGGKGLFSETHRFPPAAIMDSKAWQRMIASGRATSADRKRCEDVQSLRPLMTKLIDSREMLLPMERIVVRYNAFDADGLLRMVPGREDTWADANWILSGESRADDTSGSALRLLASAWRDRDTLGVMKCLNSLRETAYDRLDGSYSAAFRCEVALDRYQRYVPPLIPASAAVLVLLVAVASGGRRWRIGGLVLVWLCVADMLVLFAARWVFSQRAWYLPPMMTQYEAMFSSALLVLVFAAVIECFWRKTYLVLAASVYAMVVLLSIQMAQVLLPGAMSTELSALPGILSSRIMAAHVATIIIGHGFVGMTFVLSLAYMTACFVSGFVRENPKSSSADLCAPVGDSTLAVIDRCNLIAAQLACWLVLVGTVLGAVWADFAWSRWWGWDPKETWALITFGIYALLLHVRYVTPVRSRGFVTALGCIGGCGAMLFNWIVVNYILPGLHSYS